MSDEWSVLSGAYEDVLLPRFQPLYNFLANLILKHIASSPQEKKLRLLDYGTGPGEPLLTIVKLLKDNQIENIQYEGMDLSSGMIALAQQRLKNFQIDLNHSDSIANSETYAFIVSSLVLPYISNKNQLLQEFYQHLNNGGLLITCHWSKASQVAFLSILKRVILFMTNNQESVEGNLDDDSSFSCANEELTRSLYEQQGFRIRDWLHFKLSMSFPDIRTFLSFARVAPWFNDENLYLKAESEAKRILTEEHGKNFFENKSFQLENDAVIIIATKN
ncbi:unnamed protein product [Adineta ricciae]|uniref:Methyltransferase domain-containing protein n=1 Tax=Adineta ricciae TaxID=249248 RepID=A0A813RMK0_ADIRI|nr:unnamed protein product [Adineta ricciae]CAF0840359.1 unnamed protein product [Adineta ricciae]